MAADLFPEVAKRKIGNSESGESEDSTGKRNKTGKEDEQIAKRSIGEWEEVAKSRAEEKAE